MRRAVALPLSVSSYEITNTSRESALILVRLPKWPDAYAASAIQKRLRYIVRSSAIDKNEIRGEHRDAYPAQSLTKADARVFSSHFIVGKLMLWIAYSMGLVIFCDLIN
jgi:hypothetical protein